MFVPQFGGLLRSINSRWAKSFFVDSPLKFVIFQEIG